MSRALGGPQPEDDAEDQEAMCNSRSKNALFRVFRIDKLRIVITGKSREVDDVCFRDGSPVSISSLAKHVIFHIVGLVRLGDKLRDLPWFLMH